MFKCLAKYDFFMLLHIDNLNAGIKIQNNVLRPDLNIIYLFSHINAYYFKFANSFNCVFELMTVTPSG